MKKKAATKAPKSTKSVKPATPTDATASQTPVETADAPAAETTAPSEPAETAQPTKSAKPAKPPRKPTPTKRSIRYSPELQQEIVQFVHDHNAKHGRAGQASASKKYGVTVLTISKWLKAAGKPTAAKATLAAPAAPSTPAPTPAPTATHTASAPAPTPTKRGRAGRPAKKVKSGGSAASGVETTLKRMLEIRNQIAALKAEFEGLKVRI